MQVRTERNGSDSRQRPIRDRRRERSDTLSQTSSSKAGEFKVNEVRFRDRGFPSSVLCCNHATSLTFLRVFSSAKFFRRSVFTRAMIKNFLEPSTFASPISVNSIRTLHSIATRSYIETCSISLVKQCTLQRGST